MTGEACSSALIVADPAAATGDPSCQPAREHPISPQGFLGQCQAQFRLRGTKPGVRNGNSHHGEGNIQRVVESRSSSGSSRSSRHPAFGPGYQNADLVFARADGSPFDPDVVSGAFERIVRQLRLPVIRLHDLRHTHATMALAAGVHPKVVQERLGHSSLSMTLDRYSHAVPAMEADAADRIAALVDVAG